MNNPDSDNPTDKIVVVPPIVKRTEALEFANPEIPGEISVGAHGRLLKTYLTLEGPLGSHIEMFDNWVTNVLTKQLPSRKFRIPRGEVVATNPIFFPPRISTSDNSWIPLTPRMARDNGYTYSAELYADLILNKGTPQEEKVPTFIGRFPVMLGSALCHLRGKTDREKIEMGECPNDPLGYFIIKGSEKIIMIQEKLRVNRIFIFNSTSKGDVVCKMTCNTITGSSNVTIVKGKESNALEIHLAFMGRSDSQAGKVGNTVTVFQIYRMLGVRDPNQILQMISLFTKREYIKKIWVQLQPTFVEFAQIADDIEYISKKKGLGDMDYSIKQSSIMRDLKNELFTHIPPENITQKLYMLSIMISRFAEYLIGVRKLDDRDNWGNKRLESAGRSLEQLFGNIWREVVTRAQDSIDTKGLQGLQAVKREIDPSFVTDNFVSSFTANNWGVQGSYMAKENITDALKRDAHLAVYSHLTKINTPTNSKAKQLKVRLVQMSQLGYVCPVETPEGQQCGLNKNTALTNYISLERGENVILEYISKYISNVPTEQLSNPLILNGKFLGWCEGESLRVFCVALRRQSIFYKDTAIVLTKDGFLYIYTDAARPTRPLLIVDPANGELVIKNLNLWSADMKTLLDEGCVEYIDAFEQEYIQLAQDMTDIDQRRAEIEEAARNHQAAIERLSQLEIELEGTVNDDPAADTTALEREINDARETISHAANTMSDIQSLPPYTHSELDPTAILGIAASLIPLANHNQAPRNTYQCQPVSTPVLRPSYVRSQLGGLKDGDTVVTIDPTTLKMSETKIHSHFIVDSREADKKMLEITTHSGRITQATHDHRFLTSRGWIAAGKLDRTKHHLCIYPSVCSLDDTRKDGVIISLDLAKKILIETEDKHNLNLLEKMGLLPLRHNHPHLPILAKIMGFMKADDHNIMTETGDIRMTFDQYYDAELFNRDVTTLGFKANKIQECSNKNPDGTIRTLHVCVIDKWSTFCSLFSILGSVLGGKTIKHSNSIPDWIMNGSDLVKREYIAGFMGGDSCNIEVSQLKQGTTYDMGRIVRHKDHLEAAMEWFNQFKLLLEHFNIEISEITSKLACYDKYKIEMKISSARDNMIRYMDIIGYRYATVKTSDSLKVVEWFKTNPTNPPNQPNPTHLKTWMTYVYAHNECIFVPIKSIKEVEGCMVSDFTTVSKTHSFVSADGFVTHNCGMGKQALGIYHSQHATRFDTTAKCLAYPTRPLYETQMYSILGMNELPAGTSVIVAIMTYTGYNQEDALIMNKASIDRGLFRQVIYKSYKNLQKRTRYTVEEFTRPEVRRGEPEEKYAAIDENGIARLGSAVREGDCIIGKVRRNIQTGRVENASTYVGVGQEGIVDKVLVSTNPEGMRVVKVKLRQIRKPLMGDKYASRHAQKATIGLILPEEDMPYTRSGVKPDIIINPHCIPSRMTISKVIEIVTSKIAAFSGERVNATAFRRFNISEFKENLRQYGYSPSGKERMYSGFTGEAFEAQIFIGPCYYQALRHHVLDKVQMRARGAIKQLSHQPVGGRARKGGQRFGEMERDAIISHGASAFLQERLCGVSDAYQAVYCSTCGTIAIANHASDKFVCRSCGDNAQFGTCTIPYAYKLLTHILAGAGFNLQFGMEVEPQTVKIDGPPPPLVPPTGLGLGLGGATVSQIGLKPGLNIGLGPAEPQLQPLPPIEAQTVEMPELNQSPNTGL